jgi:predicted secreted protein
MINTLCNKIRARLGLVKIDDNRSQRLAVVIECILNQNARDAGAADFPALNRQILQLCDEYDVGILQIPCPEMKCLGFERKRRKGRSIRDVLDTQEGRGCCRKISVDIADRVQEYLNQGYAIVSILGGNPKSPGCAVHYDGDKIAPQSGVLIRELYDEFEKRRIEAPFRGIRDYDRELLAEDIEWVRKTFAESVKKN